MDIQSSVYAAALQQPNYTLTDRTLAAPQTDNESVSTRPVEKVAPTESSELPVLGGQVDVFV
ncbi:MAG: hypothetical protein HKP55_13150 [Gammaproteobacteria bacterium]|nr:hypothetical protein [Gammaproteobacteria bacterium]